MPNPPLNFPTSIQISNVLPGHFASSSGGGIAEGRGAASVRIDGDTDSSFSVISVETQRLVRDPDVPLGSPRTWQTIAVVEGAGPVDVGMGTAVLLTVGFTCPINPGITALNATASLVTADATPQILLQVPLQATVSGGTLTVNAVTIPVMAAGQIANFEFELISTFPEDVNGIFTCESLDTLQSFLPAGLVFPTVPAGGSVNVVLPVVCSATTAAGNYSLTFRLTPIGSSTDFGNLRVDVAVTQPRIVTLSPSLDPIATLPYLTPTLCEIRVDVSGNPATFNIFPGSVPPGVLLENSQQSVAVDGTVFVGITITVDVSAPTETLLDPLVLNWTVSADALNPEASGSISFGITTTKRNIAFGFESFLVDNCRSKGDHNDSDTLFVTVATPSGTLPAQQVLLGDNLHAGDSVQNQFLGPFVVSDNDILAVTYNVVNGAGGGTSPALALKIAGAVTEILAGLDEAHFLGLAGSSIETGLLGAVGGVFGGLGELLGMSSSDPDCSGSVLMRVIGYDKGIFAGGPQSFVPAAAETQPSPHECGNNPNSSVSYLAKQTP